MKSNSSPLSSPPPPPPPPPSSSASSSSPSSSTVAKLPQAPYPYTTLSSSPYGRLIVISGKDTIRFVSIKPSGLKEVKSIRISQFFQATRSVNLLVTDNNHQHQNAAHHQQHQQQQPQRELNDLFIPMRRAHAHAQNAAAAAASAAHPTNVVINITDIAWSMRQYDNDDDHDDMMLLSKTTRSRSVDNTNTTNTTANSNSNTGNGNGNNNNNNTTNTNTNTNNMEAQPSKSNANYSGNGGTGVSGMEGLGGGAGGGGGGSSSTGGGGVGAGGAGDDVGLNETIRDDPFKSIISMPDDLLMADDSLIAAAGSNGVVVIWRTCDILGGGFDNYNNNNNRTYNPILGMNLFGGSQSQSQSQNNNNDPNNHQRMDHFQFLQQYMNNQIGGGLGGIGGGGGNRGSNAATIGQPEAILVEHNRAVNCIAWHRNRPGIFLTASQDSTVKMFERRENKKIDDDHHGNGHGHGHGGGDNKQNESTSKWNWFGKSRSSSSSVKSFSWHYTGCFKPNCGNILDIQWSHCNDDLFAMVTNSGFLVVHNIQLMNSGRPMIQIAAHARAATTLDWHPIDTYTIATGSADRTVKVWDLESEITFHQEDNYGNFFRYNLNSVRSTGSFDSGSIISGGEASPVSTGGQDQLSHSYHGVASSSSAGGAGVGGVSSLNSNSSAPTLIKPGFHTRTPKNTAIYELSVSAQVEKVKWRPPKVPADRYLSRYNFGADHHSSMLAIATSPASGAAGGHGTLSLWSYQRPFMPLSIVEGHSEGAVLDFLWLDTPEIEDDYYIPSSYDESKMSLAGTWQHVLSIGKDGRCIVQSFARGERPLSNVAPSAFAITNLSPFQTGYGSLQIISGHQKIPSGQNNDYMLCGLRRDEVTALAPGFFREVPPSDDAHAINKFQWDPQVDGYSESNEGIDLKFSVTDSGALDELFSNSSELFANTEVKIAPEVVHLSRFAASYKIHTDASLHTKTAVCRHNAVVAESLHCEGHSRMWNILASILEGSELPDKIKNPLVSNDAMSFILYPTLKSLLTERADAGDVQTCVVLCEVMEVVVKQNHDSVTVVVPNLDLLLIRQWYLSYIDILQQMCLFSHASYLIGNCKDPEIAKLTQTSTTIHESCPMCNKPIQNQPGRGKSCRTCRRKIGHCFLCHEPVTGVYVMCPGCGHGGCLEHALEWFTSLDNPFRECCPTGCGHKCNLIALPRASHFPHTDSFNNLKAFDVE